EPGGSTGVAARDGGWPERPRRGRGPPRRGPVRRPGRSHRSAGRIEGRPAERDRHRPAPEGPPRKRPPRGPRTRRAGAIVAVPPPRSAEALVGKTQATGPRLPG